MRQRRDSFLASRGNMYVSMSELSLVLLYSLFLGVFLGCAYDVLRLSRIAVGVRYKNVSETPFDFSSRA